RYGVSAVSSPRVRDVPRLEHFPSRPESGDWHCGCSSVRPILLAASANVLPADARAPGVELGLRAVPLSSVDSKSGPSEPGRLVLCVYAVLRVVRGSAGVRL